MKAKILIILIILIGLGVGGFFVYKNLFISKIEKPEVKEEIKEEIEVPPAVEEELEEEIPEKIEEEVEIKVKPEPKKAEEIPKIEEKPEVEKKPEKEIVKIINIPEIILNNCIGFLIGDISEIPTVKKIEAGWIRPHPGPFSWNSIERSKGVYNFSVTDSLVKTAQMNNVAMLATIWPFADWDQKVCHTSACEVGLEDQFYPRDPMGLLGIPKSRCPPCSIADYQQFLKRLVERYDGDGQNDMPGLEIPIKYYEILNEPELKETFLTFFKGTKEEYVKILKASFEAIKEICDDCKVVQGGAAGVGPEMLVYWSDVFGLGAVDYFDIANIHYINAGDRSTLNVKPFKSLMDKKGIKKPIWVTEAEYGEDKDQGISTTVEGALTAGAQKIFFTRFIIGSTAPPIPGQYSQQYLKITSKCPF